MGETKTKIEKTGRGRRKKPNVKQIELQSMALLGVVFLLIFAYLPMFGILLAFKEGNNQLDIVYAIV